MDRDYETPRSRGPERGEQAMTPMREMTEVEKIEVAFTHQPPRPGSEEAYAQVRAAGKAFALAILSAAPRCADRTDAIRKVREAVMTANAAIALVGLL